MHDGEKADEQIKLLTVLFVKHIDIDTCFASLFVIFYLQLMTALDSQALTIFSDTNCASNNGISCFLRVAKGEKPWNLAL